MRPSSSLTTRYSIRPRVRVILERYRFLSFAKNISKNISKNLSGKYSQKRLKDRTKCFYMLSSNYSFSSFLF